MELNQEQKFQALLLRYQDQTELLRHLTGSDWKIFLSFFGLQIALGAWFAENELRGSVVLVGLSLIDITIAGLSVKLLWNQHKRRQEVADTIKNLNEALGFNELNAYLKGKALNPTYTRRYWFKWYATGVVVSCIGLIGVLVHGI